MLPRPKGRLSEQLQVTVRTMQDSLPIHMDSLTDLVATEAIGDTMIYLYQLRLLALDATRLLASMELVVAKKVCANRGARLGLLSRGVTMRYQYVDSTGTPLPGFDIQEARCKAMADGTVSDYQTVQSQQLASTVAN
jgi:hypothetical protein